jgi:hypothetical protein
LWRIFRQSVKRPGSFLVTVGKSNVGEQFQVTAYAGLALTKDLRKFADREIAVRQQGYKPQTGSFPGGAKILE